MLESVDFGIISDIKAKKKYLNSINVKSYLEETNGKMFVHINILLTIYTPCLR